jgi:mRNA interferase MazF
MNRGDLVMIAVSGDYGKPRPALVTQNDAFELHPSVVVLPLTSELHDAPLFRVSVPPGDVTGLRVPSQIMVDKPTTVPRTKIGPRIGVIDEPTIKKVEEALRGFLDLWR